ncbi:hypothetical protein NQ318_006845 [Aromia moschata]|uniref:V-type proton ATPase subunit S1 n=1 Tax=Aromia moschata TaxID=1265417 RepID=A0AAV8YIY8_9CUCU|nr:hypothetical protein NQ318_006845 [Aromia moschata]
MTFSDAITDGDIVLTGSSTEGLQVVFTFTSSISVSYWNLKEATATYENNEYNLTGSISDIYAPLSFSYHCGDLVLTDSANFQLDITYFQVQPFFNGTDNTTKFSDAYDCVGFTTVPIWSGLFVTSILLLIMTFGITMMMDIRTMDRFDDAKGKTITVTAE